MTKLFGNDNELVFFFLNHLMLVVFLLLIWFHLISNSIGTLCFSLFFKLFFLSLFFSLNLQEEEKIAVFFIHFCFSFCLPRTCSSLIRGEIFSSSKLITTIVEYWLRFDRFTMIPFLRWCHIFHHLLLGSPHRLDHRRRHHHRHHDHDRQSDRQWVTHNA